MSATLLIVGASARAAAQSALRARLRPIGLDLFADRDLAAIAPAHRIDPARYPEGFEALAAGLPPGPFLYTGALENHPDLIERLSRTRPLWGNSGATLRAVRDPVQLADALRRAGFPGPRVRLDPDGLPRDGTWLVKPLASAGGRGIAPLGPDFRPSRRACYFQERIEGPSYSAVLLAEARGATLIGLTRQWIGRSGAPFAYRGSLGPWPASEALRFQIEGAGRALASTFGLVGLFGLDLIVAEGQPWLVEVNPRYTASVEVLELALGRALLAEHRRACDPPMSRNFKTSGLRESPRLPVQAGTKSRDARRATGVVGKAILFAERPCVLADATPGRWPRSRRPFAVPPRADIPGPGTRFEAGDPVLTVLARGADAHHCRERLRRSLRTWERRLLDDS